MQVPAATRVRVRPETVQIVVVLEVITGVTPLVAVAVSVYGDWVRVSDAGGAKVMVLASNARAGIDGKSKDKSKVAEIRKRRLRGAKNRLLSNIEIS